MVAYALIPALRKQRYSHLCGLEASLVYIENSQIARATKAKAERRTLLWGEENQQEEGRGRLGKVRLGEKERNTTAHVKISP